MDFIRNLGFLALGSRLRRLSDQLMKEVGDLYRSRNLPFEPRWFPLFRLLSDRGPTSVGEAAEFLHQTQPGVSQIARAMQKAGVLSSQKDPSDQRRGLLQLTEVGASLVKDLQPLWRDLIGVVGSVASDAEVDILESLTRLEDSLAKRPLAHRMLDAASQPSPPQIVSYQPKFKDSFETLNREWLDRYFDVEPVDETYFRDPEGLILAPGGEIFFSLVQGKPVGTCALLPDGEGDFELGKMAVTEGFQGRGLGKALVLQAIQAAREAGAKTLHLVTNQKLLPAIALYKKLGFQVTDSSQHPKYARGDLSMALPLHLSP